MGLQSRTWLSGVHFFHCVYYFKCNNLDKIIQWGNESFFNKWCWKIWKLSTNRHTQKYHQHRHQTLLAAAVAAKSLQSCPTLCDPIDGSPPGSPVPGILQARTWSGLPFPALMHESEKWKWSRSVLSDPQRPHRLPPSRLPCPWNFPGKSTGVGCHWLLQTLLTAN